MRKYLQNRLANQIHIFFPIEMNEFCLPKGFACIFLQKQTLYTSYCNIISQNWISRLVVIVRSIFMFADIVTLLIYSMLFPKGRHTNIRFLHCSYLSGWLMLTLYVSMVHFQLVIWNKALLIKSWKSWWHF